MEPIQVMEYHDYTIKATSSDTKPFTLYGPKAEFVARLSTIPDCLKTVDKILRDEIRAKNIRFIDKTHSYAGTPGEIVFGVVTGIGEDKRYIWVQYDGKKVRESHSNEVVLDTPANREIYSKISSLEKTRAELQKEIDDLNCQLETFTVTGD